MEQNLPTNLNELRDVKVSVESSLKRIQDEIFWKYLDPKGFYKSMGKSLIGDGIGFLIPGTGVVTTTIEELRKRYKT